MLAGFMVADHAARTGPATRALAWQPPAGPATPRDAPHPSSQPAPFAPEGTAPAVQRKSQDPGHEFHFIAFPLSQE